MEKWWKVQVAPKELTGELEELDTLCFELIEFGAVTTSVDDLPSIHCFLNGDESTARRFAATAAGHGLEVLAVDEIEPQNWNERCLELWQPVVVGGIEIVPVESPQDIRPISESALRIIPGEGFGTGHHATTRMIIERLVNLADAGTLRPRRILDVGTGSGILSIVAARLFAVEIEAVDIDLNALANARDNVALNGMHDRIRISNDPLESLGGGFDLVVANLYGEVLVTLSGAITAAAAPGAILLLSGVTELVRDPVVDSYVASGGWEFVQEWSEGSWMCLELKRAL